MQRSNPLRNLLLKASYATGPDFIIIGAQKAGTSALHQMLQTHPDIEAATTKEIHYFDNDAWHGAGKIWQYHAYFPLPHNKKKSGLTFEATPMYLYHPEVAARLHAYNPKLKLIISLREPASRAFSAWTMYHHHIKDGPNRQYKEFRKFDEVVAEELATFGTKSFDRNPKGYIERGIYHEQISRFFKYFPPEQVLILENRDLYLDWEQTQHKILAFLRLPFQEMPLIKSHKSRVNELGQYEEPISKLKEFYRPYNETLYELIGREFGWNG